MDMHDYNLLRSGGALGTRENVTCIGTFTKKYSATKKSQSGNFTMFEEFEINI